jgi:hypothetical protein
VKGMGTRRAWLCLDAAGPLAAQLWRSRSRCACQSATSVRTPSISASVGTRSGVDANLCSCSATAGIGMSACLMPAGGQTWRREIQHAIAAKFCRLSDLSRAHQRIITDRDGAFAL